MYILRVLLGKSGLTGFHGGWTDVCHRMREYVGIPAHDLLTRREVNNQLEKQAEERCNHGQAGTLWRKWNVIAM
jgi:hypothetical protein